MASSIPQTMKAWQYSSTSGGLEKNLHLNPSATVPTPKDNEHLVKVIAAALNPIDYKPAEVALFHRLMYPKPASPGLDFAGTIIKPAAGSDLKPGQAVFGATGRSPLCGGALAEYAICGSKACIASPSSIDPIEMSTVPVASLTAYQTIVPKVKPGGSIFINGGSGGTGVWGIQIAKAIGCHVTTTCSSRNIELCKSLGADEVIDYTKGDVVDALKNQKRKFDLVVDNVGFNSQLYWKCHEYTNTNAIYMDIAGTPTLSYLWGTVMKKIWPGFLGGGRRKHEGFLTQASIPDMEQVRTWMEEKKVKAVIDSTFAFEDAPKAIEKQKTWRARGKIVVKVDPPS